MKIRKGDTIKVLSGKDRGKKAKVVRVLPKESRLVVEGLNLKKKHQRSRRQDKKGEMVLMPHPMAYSAVQLVCSSCGRPTRVGEKTGGGGRKVRVCKKCGAEIS